MSGVLSTYPVAVKLVPPRSRPRSPLPATMITCVAIESVAVVFRHANT